jgi:hypothetical protein
MWNKRDSYKFFFVFLLRVFCFSQLALLSTYNLHLWLINSVVIFNSVSILIRRSLQDHHVFQSLIKNKFRYSQHKVYWTYCWGEWTNYLRSRAQHTYWLGACLFLSTIYPSTREGVKSWSAARESICFLVFVPMQIIFSADSCYPSQHLYCDMTLDKLHTRYIRVLLSICLIYWCCAGHNNGDSITSLDRKFCEELVRVRATLRLAVYRQSVRLSAKPLEVHDQIYIFLLQLNPCCRNPYGTSTLTRGLVCLLWIGFAFFKFTYRTYNMLLKI